MLRPNVFSQLAATCDEMGGQLAWFDTTQELDLLTQRFPEYRDDGFNGQLYTGRIIVGSGLSAICNKTIKVDKNITPTIKSSLHFIHPLAARFLNTVLMFM